MMANMSNAAALPEWAGDFCENYAWTLFDLGKWTLIAGIVLGVVLAIVRIVIEYRESKAKTQANLAQAVAPIPLLDAVKAFLQALASAPTWLALFGGGILLLWLASIRPEVCVPQSSVNAQAGASAAPNNPQRPAGAQPPAGGAQAPAGGARPPAGGQAR